MNQIKFIMIENAANNEVVTQQPETVEVSVMPTDESTFASSKNETEDQERIIKERLEALRKEAEKVSLDKVEIAVETVETEEDVDTDEDENTGEPEVDYSAYEKPELVALLKDLVNNQPAQQIKNRVEGIKVCFYKKHNAEIAERKKKFVDAGGNPEEYKTDPDALETELKQLYKQYRELKAKHNEEIERGKQNNLKAKYQIIEDIKHLIDGNESLNKTFQDFKEYQQRWREVGPVPQSEIKNLWETYNYHIEKFYDFVKLNKELRDLDLKRNLDAKMELCEKTEELLLEPNIVKAFKELQKFHSQWRDIGPVPNEKRDEIWERFKEATTKINKKHQEYFESRKDEEENNLKAKLLLCEKAEELSAQIIASHKDWEEKSHELVEFQKIWKAIGFAPKRESNKIYERFRTACDEFFNKKREYYSNSKQEHETNLQMKTELCIQAEALVTSTDWKKTTDEYIQIQQQWKNIGPVSRKHSDIIWKRFRTACNAFFEHKKEHFSTIDAEQDGNLKQKRELIDAVKAFQPSEIPSENMKALKDFQKQFMEIGHVPFKLKDEIQKEFREAINKHFERFDFDENKRSEMKFASKLKNIQQSGKPESRIRQEREKLLVQLEHVRADVSLWENNIGFFTKSKNAESLIKEVERKIDNAKKLEASILEKLILMDKMPVEEQEQQEQPEQQ